MARGRKKGVKTKTIDSLWSEHEQKLKEAGYDYDKFKANMTSLANSNKTKSGKPSIPQAWKAFEHKEDFVSKAERGAENLWEALSKQGDLKAVRKDVFGWHTTKKDLITENFYEIDPKTGQKIVIPNEHRIKWNSDDNVYEYTNKEGEVYVFELVTGTHGSQWTKWSKK